jgi:isoleucyl-tRNA synthetase
MEEEILKFWDENKIFEKSVENRKNDSIYSFYDGPPFATGTPHYGHIVASLMKDVVPRFWTMKGFYVERKWGWDCHGLPIENIAEKELGIKRKKEIEEMGVDKFNEFCRSKVLGYVKEWEKTVRRLGRWADMKNSYRTMDLSFMESVWWVFKELWDKGLIYEGYRSMLICPRCETTLSQSETAEGYKDIKDLSITVKFELEEEPGTYILAWTTTPWTLIGNVALAIGENIDYVLIEVKSQNAKFILAKSKLEIIKEEYEIIKEFKGKELVGKKYKPAFDYYFKDENLKNKENGWKIYAGDFVTTEDGTGVVHIAPAFGEEDLQLGKKYKLPFVQHVGMDGIIKAEAGIFSGMNVKPADDVQRTDVEIMKYLDKENFLFSKDKYEHSYPHCWRCETPLINYATSSWFVNVEKIKEKMLSLAQNINWTPKHIKKGRFGNWLEGARDWSISRQRYWASVMPIWKCECGETKVIGSISELRTLAKEPITKFIFVRHGESEKTINNTLSDALDKWPLTEKGRNDVKSVGEKINDKIDIIITSPILRTKDTAKILNEKFKTEIVENDLLKEIAYGEWSEKIVDELEVMPLDIREDPEKKFDFKLGKSGESRREVMERTTKFIHDICEKYAGKTVLVVGHGITYSTLVKYFEKLSTKEYFERQIEDPDHNLISVFYAEKDAKPFDLHKDKLDRVIFECKKCKKNMKRIPDVLDTWFDSGSMPYAQMHYPFENEEKFKKVFPAKFIAEGIDQTRCWFYYLHLIASGIKESQAFDNVVVNGIVLAEDGKKMSKRLNNYPDPMLIFDKYGADCLRFYLLSSPVMAAENLNFSEREVAELVRGMFRMLWNSYSFFVLYANIDKFSLSANQKVKTTNLLDKWIVSELNVLVGEVNKSMEDYELNKAVRLFSKFVDNLSNWYIRRSRKRFWKSEDDGDKKAAYQTLWTVLVELSKLMAPFTPFISEEIYKNLTGEESVHLADFPVVDEKLIDEELNKEMHQVREIVSAGLQLRAQAKIKVRQPLKEVRYKFETLSKKETLEIIKEELNVKNVINDKNAEGIILNTEITEDLKLEGQAREIIRFIQEMRKAAGYEVDNRIIVGYFGMPEVFEKFGNLISKEVLANELKSGNMENPDLEKEFKVDEEKIKLQIKK